MFVKVTRSDHRGIESSKDQISTDVRNVIQAPKPDQIARGVAIDLLEMAKRVSRSAKPPNTKICPGRKVPPWTASLLTIKGAIKPFGDGTTELSMKAPMWVSKPADLG